MWQVNNDVNHPSWNYFALYSKALVIFLTFEKSSLGLNKVASPERHLCYWLVIKRMHWCSIMGNLGGFFCYCLFYIDHSFYFHRFQCIYFWLYYWFNFDVSLGHRSHWVGVRRRITLTFVFGLQISEHDCLLLNNKTDATLMFLFL